MFRLWRKPRIATLRAAKSEAPHPPAIVQDGTRRKTTDTDGSKRRMRQTVEDNRLL